VCLCGELRTRTDKIATMTILVFGSTGLLGNALMREWTADSVLGLSSKDADIRDAQAVDQVIAEARPDWVIHAAAYTDVDGCEANRELAMSVNRDGAAHIAEAARRHNARLLFLSTDYVFDGSKNSPYEVSDSRAPINVYGESKAEAELKVLAIIPDCTIVRTSWVFGKGGRCFPETILRLASARPELSVVNDQRGSPTYTVDLARAIIELCRKNVSGIVHVTNAGDCTWFDFATEIVRAVGLPAEVTPVTTAEFPRPAKRPANSVLSPVSREKLGVSMPDWQDALARYLEERQR
jgi:dTDP-4-dehydrorhamnose reductase